MLLELVGELDAPRLRGLQQVGRGGVLRDALAHRPHVADVAVDSRVALLLSEAFRHAKALGAAGDATGLESAGIPANAPGVVVGSLPEVVTELTTLLAEHRVWQRFPATAEAAI